VLFTDFVDPVAKKKITGTEEIDEAGFGEQSGMCKVCFFGFGY